MHITLAPNGSACPIFIAGIKYGSINGAANEIGISVRWLTVNLEKTLGAPVIVRNQFVVTDSWVRARMEKREAV
jgi:hypothetical protein